MNLHSYKDLKNVTLNKIYAKYADKKIPLLRFRGRVYEGKMTMSEALVKPLSSRSLGLTEANIYINKLYSKLCKENPIHVNRAHFIVKMSKGFSPEIAIINKYPGRSKTKKKPPVSIKYILKELKQQEAKEHKEAANKEAKPLNTKEQNYIKDINILNNAFGKVKNKAIA